MKKQKQEKLRKQKKIIMLILLSVIILGSLLLVILKLIANQSDNNQSTGLAIDDFYSSDNCRCLEREDLRCGNSSWQLDAERRICVNGKSITNVILGCSKYECNGITYELNTDIKAWEVK